MKKSIELKLVKTNWVDKDGQLVVCGAEAAKFIPPKLIRAKKCLLRVASSHTRTPQWSEDRTAFEAHLLSFGYVMIRPANAANEWNRKATYTELINFLEEAGIKAGGSFVFQFRAIPKKRKKA